MVEYGFGDLGDKAGLDEIIDGDKCFAFGFGQIGVYGNWDYLWADSLAQAISVIRKYYPTGILNIRSAFLGETDCDSFSFGGHIQH